MSTKQIDTIQDRLARRRNARNKRFQDKNPIDESEITLLNTRPKTRSLDRLPNKSSSSILKNNEELPPIQQSYLKENNLISDKKKTHSNPVLQQSTKSSSSIDIESEKQTTTKLLSNNEKSVILKESISPMINQQDELVIIQEKLQSNIRQINCYSTPQNLSNQLLIQESSSNPESAVYIKQKHFNYPIFHSKPLQRAISEQAVSPHQSKLIPLNSIFAKQNTLALPYLFNRRLIEAELSRGASLDSTNNQQKTVWD